MKKALFLTLLTFVFLLWAGPVLAQTGITNPVIGELGSDPDAAKTGLTFSMYFVILWQALISVGALLVLIYFIWGAVEWITAGGDSSKIQKARDKIVQAVIGLVVLVGSFVILGWISATFFGQYFNILELEFTSVGGAADSANGLRDSLQNNRGQINNQLENLR